MYNQVTILNRTICESTFAVNLTFAQNSSKLNEWMNEWMNELYSKKKAQS